MANHKDIDHGCGYNHETMAQRRTQRSVRLGATPVTVGWSSDTVEWRMHSGAAMTRQMWAIAGGATSSNDSEAPRWWMVVGTLSLSLYMSLSLFFFSFFLGWKWDLGDGVLIFVQGLMILIWFGFEWRKKDGVYCLGLGVWSVMKKNRVLGLYHGDIKVWSYWVANCWREDFWL